jgi:hypothetical protein
MSSPSPAQATIRFSTPAPSSSVSGLNYHTQFRVIVRGEERSPAFRFAGSHRRDSGITTKLTDLAAVFDHDDQDVIDGFAAAIPKTDPCLTPGSSRAANKREVYKPCRHQSCLVPNAITKRQHDHDRCGYERQRGKNPTNPRPDIAPLNLAEHRRHCRSGRAQFGGSPEPIVRATRSPTGLRAVVSLE